MKYSYNYNIYINIIEWNKFLSMYAALFKNELN